MPSNSNSYQLSCSGKTTGWDSHDNNINGTNVFNMTPAQVSVQAGDVDDFSQIVSHPQFDPEKMGCLTVFFQICRETLPDRYQVFMLYFNTEFRKNFRFDASRKVFTSAL